jgi:hypothetical protein
MVVGLARTPEQLSAFLALATRFRGTDTELPSVDEVVKDAVTQALEQLVSENVRTTNDATSGLDFTALSIPSELEGLTIDAVDADESTLVWQTYETYQDTTFLIQAEIDAEITLDGFAYKSDFISLEEVDGVHLHEWDWNSHMAHVGATTTARLSFQIRLEQGMDFAEDCEFEGARAALGDDPHS